jgi:hypothetical protein
MNIENLPPRVQFMFCTVMMAAIRAKEENLSETKFCEFCKGCYESVGLSDPDVLKNILTDFMMKDLFRKSKE